MNNITQDFHNSITQTLTHQPDKLSSAQPERQQMKHHLRQEGQFYSSSKAQSNQAFASGLNQEAPMSPVEKVNLRDSLICWLVLRAKKIKGLYYWEL